MPLGKAFDFYCKYAEELDELYEIEPNAPLPEWLKLSDEEAYCVLAAKEMVVELVEQELRDFRDECTKIFRNKWKRFSGFGVVRFKDPWKPRWWMVPNRLEIGINIYTDDSGGLSANYWVWTSGRNTKTQLKKIFNVQDLDSIACLQIKDVASISLEMLTRPFLDISINQWELACNTAGSGG